MLPCDEDDDYALKIPLIYNVWCCVRVGDCWLNGANSLVFNKILTQRCLLSKNVYLCTRNF